MPVIKTEDFIQSISDSLQFISYYHPKDFIQGMYRAYLKEESRVAKQAIAQILINSKMSAYGKRPICQDTGIVCVFVKFGMDVKLDKTDRTITDLVNEGVSRAYLSKTNPLRASMVTLPSSQRNNTKDNTPAIVHIDLVRGNKVEVTLSAKGGGSESKSNFAVLNPSDSITDWVLKVLPTMGAGWCPPGIIGLGIGGTAEKAMLLAKQSLSERINMHEVIERGPRGFIEELRVELYHKINALGIGAQGLGGLTTVLDVKINEYPTHAACKPIALIPNCAATRHIDFILDGNGITKFDHPRLEDWPQIDAQDQSTMRRVNLDNISRTEIESFKSGETLLLSGKLLTGRDAAHKRIMDMISQGQTLPVDFRDRFIYYVGPIDPINGETVGPAGPTTATRMDKFTDLMLSEKVGIVGMIGKAERGQNTIESIKKNKSVYLVAVGGAAYLISKSIREAKVVAFKDLGMEAIYEFEVENMPVMVAVDSSGVSIHQTGPEEWKVGVKEISII
jgi:fumarate hydratase class I